MIKQEGIKLVEFPFKKLKLFHHILFHDGPFLSHVQDEDEINYLGLWVDDNKSSNRWLVFKVDPIDLKGYLDGNTPLRDLVLSPKNDFIFLTDMSKGEYINTIMLKPSHLVADYIPEPELFYLMNIPDKYTKFFKQTLTPVSV